MIPMLNATTTATITGKVMNAATTTVRDTTAVIRKGTPGVAVITEKHDHLISATGKICRWFLLLRLDF